MKSGGFAGTFRTASLDAGGAASSGDREAASPVTIPAAQLDAIAKLVATAKPEGWRTHPAECCDRFYVRITLQRGTKLWTESWVGDRPHDAPDDATALASALAKL